VRDSSFQQFAAATRVGAFLTTSELSTSVSQIVVDDVAVAYAKVALHFHPVPKANVHRVHPTAVVDPAAELEAPVEIGPHAVVGRCRIGAGSVVMAGATIGDDCVLGRDTVIHPRATLYHRVRLGDRVIVHAGAVLGSDGFGYALDGTHWIKVPQLGELRIDDDCEIGAGTAVDRGTLGSTHIGARCKIDNLCHIAHNCVLGTDVVAAAGCKVAGSTVIGSRVVLAGGVGISGHLKIADDVRLGGGSIVLQDMPEAGDFMGHPVMEKKQYFRLLRTLRGMAERRTADAPQRPAAE
jgi:UDP-3-O-[3-hydroxymyristoyl] glucosamine N-acyltransferase